jgi:hypothetical protein
MNTFLTKFGVMIILMMLLNAKKVDDFNPEKTINVLFIG